MVEEVTSHAPEAARVRNELSINIEQAIRYAVHVVTDVAGEGDVPRVEVGEAAIERPDTLRRVMTFNVFNGGESKALVRAWIECYHLDGAPAGTFEADPALIYPGQRYRQQIDISTLPPGGYTALLLLDAGDANLIGTQFGLHL